MVPRGILITGATGTLGRKVVGAATAAGHHVRAMSRRSHVGYTGVHWAQADLLANTGVDLRTMQDYLGHRDPKHTVHYTRVAGRRCGRTCP